MITDSIQDEYGLALRQYHYYTQCSNPVPIYQPVVFLGLTKKNSRKSATQLR